MRSVCILNLFRLSLVHLYVVQFNVCVLRNACWKSYRDNVSSPKNENSVIIYSPSSSSKPVCMSLFCWTQRKIFWRMWETEQFWETIDFHSIFFSYYGTQWCPKSAWLQMFFKISLFVFGRTKKCCGSSRFGTTWGWVNDDRIFILGWTIPLS